MEFSTVPHRHVIGMRIDATSYPEAVARVMAWATAQQPRYVCVATAHMVMEGYDSPRFRQVVNGADLVTPDGMPLAWLLRALGLRGQPRVYGPDLMVEICRAAEVSRMPIGLYGGRPMAIDRLRGALVREFPHLRIAYAFAPPFRPLTQEEDGAVIDAINASGSRILFVGLGCPKQEQWMADHKGSVHAVMLGVGAAFDFHAGLVRQAPRWMQAAGLEWSFRLLMEPRRLWRRYLKHNPRFAALAMAQILGLAKFETGWSETLMAGGDDDEESIGHGRRRVRRASSGEVSAWRRLLGSRYRHQAARVRNQPGGRV